MPKNMGTIDRIIRTILAVIVIVLYLTGQISGIAAIVLGVFAAIFLVTSAIGFCPAYYPFKFSTKKKDSK
jgi:hypothetical protein